MDKILDAKLKDIAYRYGLPYSLVVSIFHGLTNSQKTESTIEKVIFNDPATIVLWSDGSKTVVKCGEDELFDPEKGLAMAISKHALGNNRSYYDVFKKWIPEESEVLIDHKPMSNAEIFERFKENIIYALSFGYSKEEPHVETCRERLAREHPECISPVCQGGCRGCPELYGYADTPDWCGHGNDVLCTKCWDRPVENQTK